MVDPIGVLLGLIVVGLIMFVGLIVFVFLPLVVAIFYYALKIPFTLYERIG